MDCVLMALEAAPFWEIVQIARHAGRELKMLSLGYPDLLVTEDTLKRVSIDVSHLSPIPDTDAVARWHSWTGKIYDTTQVLWALGITPTYIDIRQSRGVEEIVDLNQPWERTNQYDLVLDPGTLEHCFNIGQAFANVLKCMRVGGHVVHINPCTMINHGFWNLNPTTYKDFYEQNGGAIVSIKALVGPVFDRKLAELPHTKRISLPQEASLLVVARKQNEVPAIWPTQTKYQINPALKAGDTR